MKLNHSVPMELIRDGDDEPVAIRINGHEFACEEETYQTTIPKEYFLGIFDRGSFEADLAYALGRDQSVALIMVDIDHFKQINDRFGHRVGDEVLRKVAKVLSDRCDGKRSVEYRYGGDELAVILSGDDALARAHEVAEVTRTDVGSLRFTADGLGVTVSLGVAETGEDRDKDSLVRRADSGLYQAKQEGRN